MKSWLRIIKVINKRVSYPPHQTHLELLSLSLEHSACVSLLPSTTVEIKGIQHIFLYGLWMDQMLLMCKGMDTYSCRYDCFLCNNFQSVHHWDVPQTLSNRECCVPILREKECEVREIRYRINIISVSMSVLLTIVTALGLAPCCSRTLIICVFPCWAAWWSGV